MTEFDEIKQLPRDVLNLHWENKTYKLYMCIEGNIREKCKRDDNNSFTMAKDGRD